MLEGGLLEEAPGYSKHVSRGFFVEKNTAPGEPVKVRLVADFRGINRKYKYKTNSNKYKTNSNKYKTKSNKYSAKSNKYKANCSKYKDPLCPLHPHRYEGPLSSCDVIRVGPSPITSITTCLGYYLP